MTTFAVAAPAPITDAPRRSTPATPTIGDHSRRPPPETVRNEARSTQAARPSIHPAHTETAQGANAFLARMDEMGRVILEGREVSWAIEQGLSAPDIASRYGIRQGSDAYRTLEHRVEATRRAAPAQG